eukprot:656508-Rhodomonas_salina.1
MGMRYASVLPDPVCDLMIVSFPCCAVLIEFPAPPPKSNKSPPNHSQVFKHVLQSPCALAHAAVPSQRSAACA